MRNEKLKAGDRIRWIYLHHFNSKSHSLRAKKGEYFGLIKHTFKYEGEQLALVQFDGNKKTSRVPLYKLKKINQNE